MINPTMKFRKDKEKKAFIIRIKSLRHCTRSPEFMLQPTKDSPEKCLTPKAARISAKYPSPVQWRGRIHVNYLSNALKEKFTKALKYNITLPASQVIPLQSSRLTPFPKQNTQILQRGSPQKIAVKEQLMTSGHYLHYSPKRAPTANGTMRCKKRTTLSKVCDDASVESPTIDGQGNTKSGCVYMCMLFHILGMNH